MQPTIWKTIVLLLAVLLCGCEAKDPEHRVYACQAIDTPSSASQYVLPYPVGMDIKVNQGNCSGQGHGHQNFWNHGYDFVMKIGTTVTAARSGKVGWAKDGCIDGDRGCTNLITIIHDDGTVALYSHLTNGGVHVKTGELVRQGQSIGLSGDTGNTGGLPHLHFSIHPCNALPGLPNPGTCPTMPANFRNTKANDRGLVPGWSYLALPR